MKVYFAGVEKLREARAIQHFVGVKHALFSVYRYIAPDFKLKGAASASTAPAPSIYEALFRTTMLDSGIFTLMWGRKGSDTNFGKGSWDLGFLTAWQDRIVEFVKESNYRGVVVEVDCQKILDPEAAWSLRRRLRDQLPDHRLVNVWHLEDGQSGFDRLIEFSDYVGIAPLELRKHGVSDLARSVERQAAMAKQRKPSIDIHLFGCDRAAIMRRCRWCTSCDSTTWLNASKFGRAQAFIGDETKSRIVLTDNIMEMDATRVLIEQVKAWLVANGFNDGDTGARNTALNVIIARTLLRKYQQVAGPQN